METQIRLIEGRIQAQSAKLPAQRRLGLVKELASSLCALSWEGYLEELDPLLSALGAGVGHPQDPEFCPEQVGSIFLHRGHVEAENLGGNSFGADGQLI